MGSAPMRMAAEKAAVATEPPTITNPFGPVNRSSHRMRGEPKDITIFGPRNSSRIL